MLLKTGNLHITKQAWFFKHIPYFLPISPIKTSLQQTIQSLPWNQKNILFSEFTYLHRTQPVSKTILKVQNVNQHCMNNRGYGNMVLENEGLSCFIHTVDVLLLLLLAVGALPEGPPLKLLMKTFH